MLVIAYVRFSGTPTTESSDDLGEGFDFPSLDGRLPRDGRQSCVKLAWVGEIQLRLDETALYLLQLPKLPDWAPSA